jgi:hypothetical protein
MAGSRRAVVSASEYEIRIKGHVGDRIAGTFDGFDVSTETVLRAAVCDQATLHRALKQIRDLGLVLVDVQRVSDPARR